MQIFNPFRHIGQIVSGLSEISSDNLTEDFGFSSEDLHDVSGGGMIIPSTVNLRRRNKITTVVPFSRADEGLVSIDLLSKEDLDPFYQVFKETASPEIFHQPPQQLSLDDQLWLKENEK